MFGLGDSVRRKTGNQEVLTVVAVRTENLYLVQRGNDAASQVHIHGWDLELVTKAEKLQREPGLVPSRSIPEERTSRISQ